MGPVTTHAATTAYISGLSAATLRANLPPGPEFGKAVVSVCESDMLWSAGQLGISIPALEYTRFLMDARPTAGQAGHGVHGP